MMTEQLEKRHIAILGSTGSIGTQTLDVISQHPDNFQVELLTANTNSQLLIEQAKKFNPNSVVICDETKYNEVCKALNPLDIKVFAGIDSICDLVAGNNIDIVVTAMVGIIGLRPTISAIKAGKTIALANKETLVAAGEIISQLVSEHKAGIIPVDSEHSAIFQCLHAGLYSPVEKILLTGSGGPFLNSDKESIFNASVKQALNHPRWKMGAKVTIDSASLMNKGLEMIEARWLFNIIPENIEVVIHPQSIIHSMVQFSDGSVIAQLGEPDMRIPIQYALSYPHRLELNSKRVNFAEMKEMTFFEPDTTKFPCLDIAYSAIRRGGNMPCIMNAANEVAVASFLRDEISFGQIPLVIEKTMTKCPFEKQPSIEIIYETNVEAMTIASAIIKTI